MSCTPQFREKERPPAQQWRAVRAAIRAGASDRAVPPQSLASLELRYIAGKIDQTQVQGDRGDGEVGR